MNHFFNPWTVEFVFGCILGKWKFKSHSVWAPLVENNINYFPNSLNFSSESLTVNSVSEFQTLEGESVLFILQAVFTVIHFAFSGWFLLWSHRLVMLQWSKQRGLWCQLGIRVWGPRVMGDGLTGSGWAGPSGFTFLWCCFCGIYFLFCLKFLNLNANCLSMMSLFFFFPSLINLQMKVNNRATLWLKLCSISF